MFGESEYKAYSKKNFLLEFGPAALLQAAGFFYTLNAFSIRQTLDAKSLETS